MSEKGEARWVARLYPAAEPLISKLAVGDDRGLWWLYFIASGYVQRERVSEQMNEQYPNTSDLDRFYFASEDFLNDDALVAQWDTLPHEYQQSIFDLVEEERPITHEDIKRHVGRPLSSEETKRRSELLALRWCDVDLLLCQAHITRSLHRLRTGDIVFRTPKTAKARRMVSLPPSSAFLLQENKDNQEAQRNMLVMSVRDDDLIFSNHEGKPLLPDTVSHAWAKLVKRTGLKGIRLHDARHTHASLLLKQSVHPKIVQERLGHATISTTLDLYSHISPGLQEAAAIGFDKLVNRRDKEVINK